MKRKAVAAAWIVGATIPLLMATVFVFGCCVLPFHHVMHKLMPICQMAANLMRGHDGDHDHDAVPPPAREKQEPVKRIATELPNVFRLAIASSEEPAAPSAASSYRSFISQGAVRCDRDVGLHVLVEAFLI